MTPTPDALRPTHSERQTIGAILCRGREAFDEANAMLTEADFTDFASLLCWQAFARLAQRESPISLETVFADLHRTGQLADLGDSPSRFLADLHDSAGSGCELDYHASIVADAAYRRRLAIIGDTITAEARSPNGLSEDITASAYANLFALESDRNADSGTMTFADAQADAIDELNRRTQPGYALDLVATGLPTLDSETVGGFAPGELIIVAARPGRGKTALMLQLARTFANEGKRPLVFSLEMRTRENMNRILAAESQTNSRLFRGADSPTSEQAARIMDAHHRLRSGPAWINDRPETTPARLTSEARRYARKHGVRVVLVDYLQLLRPTNPREPRHLQVGEAARALKLLARSQNLVVIAAAQLNREIESRNDAIPRLSDLRDSGEIEQHADFVFFLHGDGDKQHEPVETIKLICGKGRSVPAGYVLPLRWDKPRMTFTEAGID